jgi:uncharacterized protein (TIGR00369 family)
MEEDLFSLGEKILAAQPFSMLLGAQLVAFSPGHVEMRFPLKSDFMQHMGVTHGGVISSAADTALAFAGGSVLGAFAGAPVFTSEYSINYVKPARGELLIARAWVIAASTRQAVCRCDVWGVTNGTEYVCAVAQGTIFTTQAANEPA